MVDVVIVGGGAAGLATAIFAARQLNDASIVVLDGAKKLGAKILIAGGGRCNVTNRAVTVGDYCGTKPNLIKRVLASLSVETTVAFFEEIGVALHEEAHGKLFPDTNKAATVLSALLCEAKKLGVKLCCDQRVTAVERAGEGFVVRTEDNDYPSRRVVLATGGKSLPKTGSDGGGYVLAEKLGHTLIPITPSLAPLVLDGTFHAELSGISQEVELCVRIEAAKPIRMRGDLLWTHFGVSGPVVLDASRHWHRGRLEGNAVEVTANLWPGLGFEQAEQRLLDMVSSSPKTQVNKALSAHMSARAAGAVLDELGIKRTIIMAQLSKEHRRKLVHALLAWPLPVRDSRGYNYAEVTAGGVALDEVNVKTMESRKCPGLYLVGEILDVDGRIGGFNFQWAWSSGYVAARGLRLVAT